MNNLEDNLSKIKIKELTKEDKDSLWHSIMIGRMEAEKNKKLSVFNIFNFHMNKIIVGIVALVLILGGGGVVAASNNAVPGSFLFPVELALENIQLKLSGDDKKEELRLRFTEERLEEIREISEKRSVPINVLVADLSASTVLEIEADVFTDETIVKIEADNKNYGYISTLKTKEELVKEIALKYSLTEDKVNSVIDFEVEDRASRADDKGFLNKTRSINFSEDESEDVSRVLSDIDAFLSQDGDNQDKEELRSALAAILTLLGDDGKLEIRRDDGKIKIETKDGEVEIKIESDEGDDDKDDDSKNDDDDSDDGSEDDSDDSISDDDVKEDDGEVFCRGEWRDEDDCEDDDSDDDSDDSDEEDDEDDDDDDSDDEDDSEDDSDDEEDDDN